MVTEIDLGAIRKNAENIEKKTGKPLILMCKADAYGHGAMRVAQAVPAVYYGVATEEEGIPLRELGKEVLVTAPSFFKLYLTKKYDLIPLIGEKELAEAAVRIGVKRCHLKVNSGMNRLGFQGAKACYDLANLLLSAGVNVEGVCTHYKDGSAANVKAQNKVFDEAVLAVKKAAAERGAPLPITHVTGSGGAFASSYDYLRVGLAAYGYSSGDCYNGIDLRPVMRVTGEILKRKLLKKGETLGYSGSFCAPSDLCAYTVAGGYADGILRSECGREVICSGRRGRIAAICMDSFEMISPNVDFCVGDRVIILSKEVDAAYIAAYRNTIPYEVLIGYNVPRAEKIYVDKKTSSSFDPRACDCAHRGTKKDTQRPHCAEASSRG